MQKKYFIFALVLLLGLMFELGCGGAPKTEELKQTESKTESQAGTDGAVKQTGETSIDPALLEIQDMVDKGRQTWRTDPVAVAKETVINAVDYKLISNDGLSKAQVDAIFPDKIVHVYLHKPVRQDATGIWAIERSTETPK